MVPPARIENLIEFDRATLRVSSREGKHREFKRQFNPVDFSRYTKVLAAFCNTDGGTLIFGVAEAPRRILGVDPTTIPDDAAWTDRLRKDFDPEIPLEVREYRTANRTLVAINVERHLQSPVICKREATVPIERGGKRTHETVIQQGAIYYRQSGQVRPIAFSELQEMLHKREERRIRAFLENVQIMQKIGPERIGVVDASRTGTPGEMTNLYVSREVAKSLNFIDKGRFVESAEEGSPAYVVAGSVQLNQIIERPFDDLDRSFPNEAAEQIRPVVEELFGAGTPFTGHHLTKLSKHLGIRNGEETDPRYCVYDRKVKRAFYLRAGIQHIKEQLRKKPED